MHRARRVLLTSLIAGVLTAIWLVIAPTTLVGGQQGTASLSVIAESGPSAEVAVEVSGPHGYSTQFTGTKVLRNLVPGEYLVTASAVANSAAVGGAGTGVGAPAVGAEATAVPADISTSLDPEQHAAVTIAALPSRLVGSATGSPAELGYSLEADTIRGPARWDPCRAITWAPITPLPESEVPLLATAFAKAGYDSGLTFEQVAADANPAVLVDIEKVAGNRVDGEGTIVYFPPTETSNPRAMGGRLEADIGAATPSSLRVALYLHEIGHVVGLGHVDDPTQVMYPTLEESDGDGYAAGDRAGLRALGAAAGCLSNPLPAQDAVASVSGPGTPATITLTWFQPASDPPVTSTSLRLTSGADDTTAIRLLDLPNVPAAGAIQTEMQGAADACTPGARLTLVTQNANGETETPVSVTGCPRPR